MTSRLEAHFSMIHYLSEQDSFYKKHICTRVAAFPLIFSELAELGSHIFYTPTDAFAKVSIMCGKKIISANPQETWEAKWQPLETLKKVAKLFLGLLSSLLIGWWAPTWNQTIHEKLYLIPTMTKPVLPVTANAPTPTPKGISIQIQQKPAIAKLDTTSASTNSTPISTPVGSSTVPATSTMAAVAIVAPKPDVVVAVAEQTPVTVTPIIAAGNTDSVTVSTNAPAIQSEVNATAAAKPAEEQQHPLAGSIEEVVPPPPPETTAQPALSGGGAPPQNLAAEAAGGGTVTAAKPSGWTIWPFGGNAATTTPAK